jgi:hypothetical protein
MNRNAKEFIIHRLRIFDEMNLMLDHHYVNYWILDDSNTSMVFEVMDKLHYVDEKDIFENFLLHFEFSIINKYLNAILFREKK